MAHVWPIGGGKGGSGKSFITSSLGRLSAELGKKTLIIDLDLGAANLHTLVGVPEPKKGFSDFIRKKIPLLEDTVVETPSANLFLISGAHDNFDIANLSYEQKIRTLRAIAKLDFDRILLDNVVKPWLRENFDLPEDLSNNPKYRSLIRMATWAMEKAKIELSQKESTHIGQAQNISFTLH